MYNILTYEGLQVYDDKIKEFIGDKTEECLTEGQVNAIINGVDLDSKYILFSIDDEEKKAYRHPSGDVAGSNNARTLCFSLVDGTKYYVAYDGSDGAWSDSTSTLTIGSTVYSDSACTTSASTISGGTDGFVTTPSVTIKTMTIDGTEFLFEEGMTWAQWVDSEYNIYGYRNGGDAIFEDNTVHYHIDIYDAYYDTYFPVTPDEQIDDTLTYRFAMGPI